jgi:hypothetical protein
MKIFSADAAPPPLDRPTAWAFTITNLVTLPGLGSLAAGRRVGWAQATLALTGFGLTMWWLVRTVLEWFASGELPVGVTSTLLLGLAGVACFGVAWLWALLTSLLLLREARENERIAASAKGGTSTGH